MRVLFLSNSNDVKMGEKFSPQNGRGSSRIRPVPHPRTEARLLSQQRAGRRSRGPSVEVPQARLVVASHALQCKGDIYKHGACAFVCEKLGQLCTGFCTPQNDTDSNRSKELK